MQNTKKQGVVTPVVKTVLFLVIVASFIDCLSASIQQSQDLQDNQLDSSASPRTSSALKLINNNGTSSIKTENNTSSDDESSASQADYEQYWLNRRDLFFNLTTFSLVKVSCCDRAINFLVAKRPEIHQETNNLS